MIHPQEEECNENFKKSCFIEYKKVAIEEPVRQCYTPLICEGEGPEECKTVYESRKQDDYMHSQACSPKVPLQ